MHDVGVSSNADQCLWRKCLNGMKNVAKSLPNGGRGEVGGSDLAQVKPLTTLPFTPQNSQLSSLFPCPIGQFNADCDRWL